MRFDISIGSVPRRLSILLSLFTILYNLPHCSLYNNDFRQLRRNFFFLLLFLSRETVFYWIVALKKFAILTRKQSPLNKVFIRPANLLKKDSVTGVFLWILQNFWEHLFCRTSAYGSCGYFSKLFSRTLKEATLHFNIFQFCLFWFVLFLDF